RRNRDAWTRALTPDAPGEHGRSRLRGGTNGSAERAHGSMTDVHESGDERRARIVQQMRERTGIDERMIEQLVHSFYARVREDPMLGPIFNSRVQDWDTHLKRMCAFWSSVALSSGVYHGQPMRMHLPLPVEDRKSVV